MKKGIGAILVVFCLAVCIFGFTLSYGGGTTYEFQQVEFIENYTEGDFSSVIGKPKQNEKNQDESAEMKALKVSQTYKANTTLTQAQFRLIEKESGKKFAKTYSYTIDSVKGTAEPNSYYWVVFQPKMSKLTGYIIKKYKGKEEKTYVEVVYPKADPNNSKKVQGEAVFKNAKEKPAEKLS